jgi:hypothetical protein
MTNSYAEIKPLGQATEFFILNSHIGPFAYGEMGIFDGDEYVDTSPEKWGKWARHRPRDAWLPLKRASHLPDLLVGMPYMCLRERAYELFVNNLKLWDRFHWVSVRAIDQKKRNVGRYWWPMYNEADFVNVLDLATAEVEWLPLEYGLKPNKIRKVLRWVLDAREIRGLDLFVGNELTWFASPKLRQLVIDEKLTGFGFQPVAVSV